jgi:hypothetical protein
MQKYLLTQTFSAAIMIVLVLTFYIMLAADMVTHTQSNMTNLILIIIAIICIAILSTLTNI